MTEYPTLFGCATGGDGQIIIVGAPFDRGTDAARAGCAAAPTMLRTLSTPEHIKVKDGALYDLAKREIIFPGKVISDLGNIRFRPSHQTDSDYLDFFASAIAAIARSDKKPLVLGGDHLVTLSTLRGLARAGKIFQVLHFDAHHDYDRVGQNELPTHASFMSFVANENLAQKVVQVGVRGLSWGEPTMPLQVEMASLDNFVGALLPNIDVYITVDTDAFDPMLAPGVSYPIPEGLTLGQFNDALTTLTAANIRLIGADWMEYNPTYDASNNITGRVILHGLAQLIRCLSNRLD